MSLQAWARLLALVLVPLQVRVPLQELVRRAQGPERRALPRVLEQGLEPVRVLVAQGSPVVQQAQDWLRWSALNKPMKVLAKVEKVRLH
jgi:hypothetical protein